MFLTQNTCYKERQQDTLKAFVVSVDCIKGNILHRFFKTATSQESSVCLGADGQMDIVLSVYRDFQFCN